MRRQWLIDIGNEKTVVDRYRALKDSGRQILGTKRQWSTDIGYGKTVVDRYRV